jgi:cell division septum initiation protein DivIVA
VDRLEELLGRGSSVPFSGKVIVDREMLLNVIDQMRVSIPEEIKEAKRLLRDREKEVSAARDEAARIISEAREDAARLADEHEIRASAEEQASRMIEEARASAQDIILGADDYASDVLRELAEHLDGMQNTVYNGLSSLERRRSRPLDPDGVPPREGEAEPSD